MGWWTRRPTRSQADFDHDSPDCDSTDCELRGFQPWFNRNLIMIKSDLLFSPIAARFRLWFSQNPVESRPPMPAPLATVNRQDSDSDSAEIQSLFGWIPTLVKSWSNFDRIMVEFRSNYSRVPIESQSNFDRITTKIRWSIDDAT